MLITDADLAALRAALDTHGKVTLGPQDLRALVARVDAAEQLVTETVVALMDETAATAELRAQLAKEAAARKEAETVISSQAAKLNRVVATLNKLDAAGSGNWYVSMIRAAMNGDMAGFGGSDG